MAGRPVLGSRGGVQALMMRLPPLGSLELSWRATHAHVVINAMQKHTGWYGHAHTPEGKGQRDCSPSRVPVADS